MRVSYVKRTSFAVSSCPSWKRTPRRSRKTMTGFSSVGRTCASAAARAVAGSGAVT